MLQPCPQLLHRLGVAGGCVAGSQCSCWQSHQLLSCRCATCLCWQPQWWRLPSARASSRCGRPSQLAQPQLLQQLRPPAWPQPQHSQTISRRVLLAARQLARGLCSCHTAWCSQSPQQRASSCMTPRCAYFSCVLPQSEVAAADSVEGGGPACKLLQSCNPSAITLCNKHDVP